MRIQLWTASRCQRLLRPLLTRIGNLRKSASQISQLSTNEVSLHGEASAKRPAEDCSWLGPRKKLRHTYSQRASGGPPAGEAKPEKAKFKPAKDLQRDSNTGGIIASTPLLRRARGYNVSSPVQQPTIIRDDGQKQRKRSARHSTDVGVRFGPLKTQVSPARYADYEAIYRNTEVLLSAVGCGIHEKGASSFMDMCLRKVPQYVAGVEAWVVHEAEENGTKSNTTGAHVAPRVYSELESLGPSGNSWTHLKTVMQADALGALAGAIAEGLFPDELTTSLIELCSQYGSHEISELIEVFLRRHYPEPLGSESSFAEDAILRPLSFLRDFSARASRPSLLLQQLASLLLQGLLPSAWLATREFENIWGLAYRMISKGQPALAAVDFLATATVSLHRHQLLGNKPKQLDATNELALACRRASIRTLSIIAGMRRLGEDEIQSGNVPTTVKVERIGRSLDLILRVSLAEIESWKGRRAKLRGLLCLATFLSSPESQGEIINSYVTRFINSTHSGQECGADHSRQGQDGIISLLASIAKICGRGTSQASRHYLAAFCNQLGGLELQNEAVEDTKRAGAFFLAQQSNDLRDLLYAEKLISYSGGLSKRQASMPGKRAVFEGYRWDESISEWVRASPVIQRKNSGRRSLRSSMGECINHVETLVDTNPPSPERSVGLAFLVADLSSKQGFASSVKLQTPDRRKEITTGMTLGAASRPYQLDFSVSDERKRTSLNKCHSYPSENKVAAFCDELSDDKENCAVGLARKTYSITPRQPLAPKRRIRLSWGDDHSDDELGL